MDALALSLLEKLFVYGEKERVGQRSTKPSLKKHHLKDYLGQKSLQSKESFDTTVSAARAAGAIEVVWDKDMTVESFIQEIHLLDIKKLAKFLNKVPNEEKTELATTLLSPYMDKFPVLNEVVQQWSNLKSVRSMGPLNAQDFIDSIAVIEYAKNNALLDTKPIREASNAIFKDTKRIEKIIPALDVLLTGSIFAISRSFDEVLNELGLFREEQPVRMAGNVVVERARCTTVLDAPYSGFNAGSVFAVKSPVDLVLTIENLTTFHSEARRRCDENILLLYSHGMPAPAWRTMYKRILGSIDTETPVYHWGDIDEGGFRIASVIAKDAISVGHTLKPWMMHPDNIPKELRCDANDKTVQKMQYFASAAGWLELSDAIGISRFTVEQEGV